MVKCEKMATKMLFFSLVLFLCIFYKSVGFLLWPRYTVFQITGSFSVPVEIPKRRLYFDWGFQMNYDMPFDPESFYDPQFWPGIFSKRSIDQCYEKYDVESKNAQHDMTAGEFYEAIEDLLISYGFHETCLLKSVCEISQHPFDTERNNILAELLTFALSPSLHQGFSDGEVLYKEVYEAAEMHGFLGANCTQFYPKCEKDFINLISKVSFND